MPIYEYACSACGHQFEEWQKMSDKPVRTCPKCKAKKVEKLISHTSFTLKGGGWYSDLYSSGKPPAKDSSASSSSDAATPAKKDSKTEAKSDSTTKKSGDKAKKTGAA